MLNITPISSMPSAVPASAAAANPIGGADMFKDMFGDALKNLESLEAVKEQDAIDLAIGNIDDLSQLQINGEKAEIALQLFVEMRNKLLDGYNEIMRMNV